MLTCAQEIFASARLSLPIRADGPGRIRTPAQLLRPGITGAYDLRTRRCSPVTRKRHASPPRCSPLRPSSWGIEGPEASVSCQPIVVLSAWFRVRR